MKTLEQCTKQCMRTSNAEINRKCGITGNYNLNQLMMFLLMFLRHCSRDVSPVCEMSCMYSLCNCDSVNYCVLSL